MKVFFSYRTSLYAGAFILALFLASCDQPKQTNAAVQHPDSLSVKKMDADSNSEMPPVITEDDTPAKMPNPYDPEDKASPIK